MKINADNIDTRFCRSFEQMRDRLTIGSESTSIRTYSRYVHVDLDGDHMVTIRVSDHPSRRSSRALPTLRNDRPERVTKDQILNFAWDIMQERRYDKINDQ